MDMVVSDDWRVAHYPKPRKVTGLIKFWKAFSTEE